MVEAPPCGKKKSFSITVKAMGYSEERTHSVGFQTLVIFYSLSGRDATSAHFIIIC